MKSKNNQEFIEKAGKLLNPDKWKDFLLKWAETLESYGTPTSFVDLTRYEFHSIEFDKKYPFVYTISENHAQRRALMAEQKDYMNKLKTYGFNLDLKNCFICQNIAQGIDSQLFPEVKNNVMYWPGNHAIAPNRYPNQLGHSLSDLINHDDITDRVIPKPDPDNPGNKTAIYNPEPRKTRGAIITSQYLDALMASCDSLNLIALRNHVLDGMSIPGHDHFHLMPEDLPSVSLIGEILREKQIEKNFQKLLAPYLRKWKKIMKFSHYFIIKEIYLLALGLKKK